MDTTSWEKQLYPFSLAAASDQFRLVRLVFGADQASDEIELQCELKSYVLKDVQAYTALSYVWGDPTKTLPIKINGIEWAVTENLYAALEQLARLRNSSLLWIDAICIHQADVEERQSQVMIMNEIYRNANQVLVWMGPTADNSQLALQEIERLGGLSRKEHITDMLDVTSHAVAAQLDHFLELVISTLSGHAISNWRPMLRFFDSCWWSRIWVIQETALSHRVQVLYGRDQVDWADVIATLALFNLMLRRWRFLQIHPLSARQAIYYCLLMIERRTKVQFAIWSVLQTSPCGVPLRYVHSIVSPSNYVDLQATDARDYVYGLLGLLDQSERDQIVVRYDREWTPEETYIQAAKMLFTNSDISVLSDAEPMDDPTSTLLPSWVPTWKGKRSCASLGHSLAREIRLPDSEIGRVKVECTTRMLHVPGWTLCEIAGVSSVSQLSWTDCTTLQEKEEYVQHFFAFIAEITSLVRSICGTSCTSESEVIRNVYMLLTLDLFGEEPSSELVTALGALQSVGERIRVAKEHVCETGAGPSPHCHQHHVHHSANSDSSLPEENPSDYAPYFERVSINKRRVFVSTSSTKLLGICSRFAQPGDRVCILNGHAAAFVVRNDTSRDRNDAGHGAQSLIGSAFIHGIRETEVEDGIPGRPLEVFHLH